MNRYYTETIPVALAKKLKEKRMPLIISLIPNYLGDPECEAYEKVEPPTYAEVFDWLMERGLRIVIEPFWDFANERITDMWCYYIVKVGTLSSQPKNTISQYGTWHEAAEAAIEKALELI